MTRNGSLEKQDRESFVWEYFLQVYVLFSKVLSTHYYVNLFVLIAIGQRAVTVFS